MRFLGLGLRTTYCPATKNNANVFQQRVGYFFLVDMLEKTPQQRRTLIATVGGFVGVWVDGGWVASRQSWTDEGMENRLGDGRSLGVIGK